VIRTDVAIIGAGMAGASLAASVAPERRVVMIEAEAQPGYHATGRSAAFWSESYGGPGVQPLTSASGPFLSRPPAEFAERGFLGPRGHLHIADVGGRSALGALARDFAGSGVEMRALDRPAIEALVPGILPGWDSGVIEPSCQDIDVAGLHAAYLRAARLAGAELHCGRRVAAIEPVAGGWRIEAGGGEPILAAIVVNAAGAWASAVARMAGALPIAITPYRRTMLQLRLDRAVPADMPLVADAVGRFYFKPEAGGRIWLSPHDEIESSPVDAAPEEIDIAIAIDRLEKVVDWRVVSVERKWAGLRSFAPDRLPVYGFDPHRPGFFWFAGQGGFGIQTAPAAAMIGAALLTGRAADPAVAAIDASAYAPQRFG